MRRVRWKEEEPIAGHVIETDAEDTRGSILLSLPEKSQNTSQNYMLEGGKADALMQPPSLLTL